MLRLQKNSFKISGLLAIILLLSIFVFHVAKASEVHFIPSLIDRPKDLDKEQSHTAEYYNYEVYNLFNHKTKIYDGSALYEKSLMGSYDQDSLIKSIQAIVSSRGFELLELIEDPMAVSNTWPNCKIFMKDLGDNGEWYASQGSGVLIAPRIVVTASHNIFWHYLVVDMFGTIVNFDRFADSIFVVPVYDENVFPPGFEEYMPDLLTEPEHPYFRHRIAEELSCQLGWTVSHDYDFDIGIIILKEPIGSITGYYDFGYKTDEDFYLTSNFQIYCYPSEPPYDGLSMYFTQGVFDYANIYNTDGYVLRVDDFKGPAGMSGGGIFYQEGEDNFVTAVASWRDYNIDESGVWSTYFCGIDASKYNFINSLVQDWTPNYPDITPLCATAQPKIVLPGDALTSLGFFIANQSSETWSGDFLARSYLSNDTILSVDDHLLITESFEELMIVPGSAQELFFTAAPIRIPLETGSGKYFIIIEIVLTEVNQDNNVTGFQDDAKLTVRSDDSYELNNDISQAYDLKQAENTWLQNLLGKGVQWDDDWFFVPIPNECQQLSVDCILNSAEGNIDLELYDMYGSLYAGSYGLGNEEHVEYSFPKYQNIQDSPEDVVIYELKNDDGSWDRGLGWVYHDAQIQPELLEDNLPENIATHFFCCQSPVNGLIDDDLWGFVSYLEPPTYPFALDHVSMYFMRKSTTQYGFYLHVWDDQFNELLPVPILIPENEVTAPGWWSKTLSEYNITIEDGGLWVGLCQKFMPYYPYPIPDWPPPTPTVDLGADVSSQGNSYLYVEGHKWSSAWPEMDFMIRAGGYLHGLYIRVLGDNIGMEYDLKWELLGSCPEITNVTPSSNSTSCPVISDVVVNFNTEMDPITINESAINVTGEISGNVNGTISYNSANNSLIFSHTDEFASGELVTVIISKDIIKSVTGNELSEGYWFQFETATSSKPISFNLGPFYSFPYYYIRFGDVNDDGQCDIVIVYGLENKILIFISDPSGAFVVESVDLSQSISNIDTGVFELFDVDGDHDLDIIIEDEETRTLYLWKNNGFASFSFSSSVYSNSNNFWDLDYADIDCDGDNDLIAGMNGSDLAILKNVGNGQFQVGSMHTLWGVNPFDVEFGDIDNDGDPDIVNHYCDKDSIGILFNDGSGEFYNHTKYPVGMFPIAVVSSVQLALADFDTDSDLDIITANLESGDSTLFTLCLNQGNGVFTPTELFYIENSYIFFEVGDMDGDSDIDIAFIDDDSLFIAINDGSGAISEILPVFIFEDDLSNYRVSAMHDIDRDGDLDLVLNGGGLQILKNGEVICGDVNVDNNTNIMDAVFMINYLYRNGPAPIPLTSMDVNNSNSCNILDASYIINYLYRGGPEPNCPE